MPARTRVAFVGVGSMGGPIVRRLLEHNAAEVVVVDRNAEAVASCVAHGAVAAGSVAASLEGARVVFTSLPKPADVEAVALGAGGLLEHAVPGTVYFDLSTSSLDVVERVGKRLAEVGVTMLDAPVSGGVEGAEAGTLAVMVGGDGAALEANRRLLETFAANVFLMGELGAGTIAKLVNNMLCLVYVAATAEGLMLGAAAGLDPSRLVELIKASSGDSLVFRGISTKILGGDFSPSFALDLAYKDCGLALALADDLDVPVPQGAQAHTLMRMAKGMGLGALDISAVARVYETLLGREVRAAPVQASS